MSAPDKTAGWGPSHQTGRRGGRGIGPAWFRRPLQGLVVARLLGVFSTGVLCALVVVWGVVALAIEVRVRAGGERNSPAARILDAPDRLAAVHGELDRAGGGTYLGVDGTGAWRVSGRERAVLVLGPPPRPTHPRRMSRPRQAATPVRPTGSPRAPRRRRQQRRPWQSTVLLLRDRPWLPVAGMRSIRLDWQPPA